MAQFLSRMSGFATACGFAVAAMCGVGVVNAMEVITVRSGQSGGLPGAAGAADDIVTFNPWGNPSGVAVSGSAFTAADFASTASGAAARVVNPQGAWMGGVVAPLSDPLARWINYAESGGYGPSGSVLYAVPFWINTASITSAILTMEGGVDDVLGDWYSGGPNPDGLYVNGFLTGYQYQGFNFAYATTHTQSITAMVSPGLNYLYFYQRDIGYGAGGIIFSATITVVPGPQTAAVLGLCGLLGTRRRR